MPELEFPLVERPLVSIVMLTYNDVEWIPRALRACFENTDACYELIVVDNGSTDGTVEFLTTETTGARVLLNERNYGFGAANNLGADHAIGRYLFFLNSDAFVHPGWLPPLLEVLEADETVAAVGPRLLNLDGSLQLAGALLTRAGATVVYGDGDDPDLPQYDFARNVDFSGACLLFRRSTFNEVGGFDPAFGLIYFEDADLCLALWKHGYRVVYEPRSTLTHVGGSGSEPSQPVLQLALRNRSLFERRWRALLASYPPAPLDGERRLIAARDIRSSDRILVLGQAACAEAIARTFRSARVTLVTVEKEARAVSNREIELAYDAEHILRGRRFHYDVVIGDVTAMETFAELLGQTQPQAVQIRAEHFLDILGEPDCRRLLYAAASAGVAPPRRPYAPAHG
jgi:GT2 family glycosyltransferase